MEAPPDFNPNLTLENLSISDAPAHITLKEFLTAARWADFPYVCPWRDCARNGPGQPTFLACREMLERHVLTHSREKFKGGVMCRWLGCRSGRPWRHAADLREHIRTAHFSELEWCCPSKFCLRARTFNHHQHLEDHFRLVHSNISRNDLRLTMMTATPQKAHPSPLSSDAPNYLLYPIQVRGSSSEGHIKPPAPSRSVEKSFLDNTDFDGDSDSSSSGTLIRLSTPCRAPVKRGDKPLTSSSGPTLYTTRSYVDEYLKQIVVKAPESMISSELSLPVTHRPKFPSVPPTVPRLREGQRILKSDLKFIIDRDEILRTHEKNMPPLAAVRSLLPSPAKKEATRKRKAQVEEALGPGATYASSDLRDEMDLLSDSLRPAKKLKNMPGHARKVIRRRVASLSPDFDLSDT